MDDAYGLEGMGGPAGAMAGITAAGIRGRRGLRVALLSLAVTILLLGAAIAGVFGYHAVSGGSAAAAAFHAGKAAWQP